MTNLIVTLTFKSSTLTITLNPVLTLTLTWS